MTRTYSCVAAVVAALWMMAAGVAAAAPAGCPVLLGFGSEYAVSGESAVHRGVDVACSSGAPAYAPIDGVVSFAGRVPSAAGGTVLTVTVKSGDDLISITPLNALVVERGQRVGVGDALGIAAVAGDPSSEATHLHVSLRRSGVYLDPSSLLAVAANAPSESPVSETRAADAKEGADSGTTAAGVTVLAEGVALAPGVSAGVVSGSCPADAIGVGAETVRPARAPNGLAGAANGVSLASGEVAQGVSLQPADNVQSPHPAAAGWGRIGEIVLQAGRAVGALSEHVLGQPMGLMAVAAAFASLGLLFSRRALERRLQSDKPVSDRFETLLQHVRTGDTLRGLTSCSGFLPSQSRGRLAQRR